MLNQSDKNLSYEMRLVSDLIPYARNARTHSDEQVNQIAGSIKEFGFISPVIIDRDGGVIAGHGRLMAAQKLGLKEVPCIIESHLTENQKRAYILADNRLALNAGWDREMMSIELSELKAIDFNLGTLGFNDDEINLYLADVPSIDQDNEAMGGNGSMGMGVGEIQHTLTKPGEVWLLGTNRLYCGDGNEADAIIRHWESNTGKKATNEKTCVSFDELESQSKSNR